MKTAIILLAASVTACTSMLGDFTVDTKGLAKGAPWSVDVDEHFTVEERADLNRCFDAWREFTDGNVDLVDFPGGVIKLRKENAPDGSDYKIDVLRKTAYLNTADLDPQFPLEHYCKILVGVGSNVPTHEGTGVMGKFYSPTFTSEDKAVCVSAGVCKQ